MKRYNSSGLVERIYLNQMEKELVNSDKRRCEVRSLTVSPKPKIGLKIDYWNRLARASFFINLSLKIATLNCLFQHSHRFMEGKEGL